MSDLTNEQLKDIVKMIIDFYGPRLSSDELTEIISLTLLDIAGFETADPQLIIQTISDIRSQYYDQIEQNKSNS